MNSQPPEPSTEDLLARGGGNATASGVSFQASVGAIFSACLLAERNVDDRLGLADAHIRSIRFEAETPLDDILIETETPGWIFIQCKTTLSLSENLESEFGKTAEQIVRQWKICADGDGKRGWDRPLDVQRDRMVIIVGPDAPGSIKGDLATGLGSLHAPASALLTQAQQRALDRLKSLLVASWRKLFGDEPSDQNIAAILRLIYILQFAPEGADRIAAIETLRHVTADAGTTAATFEALCRECERLMSRRHGTNAANMRGVLSQTGLRLRAPPSYLGDVERLVEYSADVQSQLEQYEETKVDGLEVRVDRACTAAVTAAAKGGSLVLVGDPGAGKSGVISAAAQRLRTEHHSVIELAVDRLPVDSLEGLATELRLTHPLRDVLENWPGTETAFLFIDALDATRGGKSEAVFRTIISDVLNLAGGRWHVVASIRSFDLRLGEKFRELYRGKPPADAYKDPAFSNVRHIHVPSWSPEELADFLQKAPAIATAVQRGGERIRDLALVPFNTRLLADLISGGIPAEAFGDIDSQVQLLELYWQHRVARHGTAAELCLRNVVANMVSSGVLQADKLHVAQSDPGALDNLLKENVLVPLPGNRKLRFPHHILFDYAASRVFINPSDITATAELLRHERGLGLMLAPALSFALQGLWAEEEANRASFWSAVAHFAGDLASDPVARSVAARAACELPASAEQMNGFITILSTASPDQERALRAFSHVVGALAVRLDDKQPIQMTPWCHIASALSDNAAPIVWPLRTLLFLLVERAEMPEQRALLGRGARAVLRVALDQELPYQLTVAAIGFVADTYASDPAASRRLLERLFDTARLERHAHEDMPWLARKASIISRDDPAFVVDMYKTIFGFTVKDEIETSIGDSHILPLRSNRRQDYDMARYALKEAFPTFLRSHPLEATRALIAAMEGYVANSHPLDEQVREETVRVGEFDIKVIEDRSHIWAWDPDNVHSDNATALVQAFRSYLLQSSAAHARLVIEEVMRNNRLAILWSRMFMAGGGRPHDIGCMLWSVAIRRPFLDFEDTRKDAIDLIAARYPLEEQAARQEFEQQIMLFDFPKANDPARAREVFLSRVLGAIGPDNLTTYDAREFLLALPQNNAARGTNPRPFKIFTSFGTPPRFHWLKDRGVDIDAPPNASLLNQTEEIQEQLGLFGKGQKTADLRQGVEMLRALVRSTTEASEGAETHLEVIENARETVAQGCDRLSQETQSLRDNQAALNDLCELVDPLLTSESPQVGSDTETKHEKSMLSSGGARLDAAQAAINLSNVDEAIARRFMPELERLVRDPHPEVRLAIANSLGLLWNTAREPMWRLAEIVAREEQNRRVLCFFASFLSRLIHADPAHVETLILDIIARVQAKDDKPGEELKEATGALMVLLWVSHERSAAHEILLRWLQDVTDHEPELGHAIHAIREGLVLGYGNADENDAAIRLRCQDFAAQIVAATAAGLKRYFALPEEVRTDDEARRARLCAKLLDEIGDQFYFASGAFREGRPEEDQGLLNDEARREFLADNGSTFRSIGDVGTPHTIFHLIEMLGFLMPGNPGLVFDLVAHALLTAGRNQGYQFESLGADRFVEVIGRFLADHRELFDDADRRGQLVACLDAFVEAGWPSARRLLYRLPELLQ